MSDSGPVVSPSDDADPDAAGKRNTATQSACLPPSWRRVDTALLRGTEYTLFATGVLFAAMITLEVISRYVFNFSISFVNALARLLLVWFFLLGAGIAMRRGAHVGFELIVSAIPPRSRAPVVQIALFLTAVFCLEMIWAGVHSMGPAMMQTEAGLGVSLAWGVFAIPCGFALLLYHTLVVMWSELRRGRGDESAP
jgi:TRAP-type C4-dicarboxylate transport system permease small subunit